MHRGTGLILLVSRSHQTTSCYIGHMHGLSMYVYITRMVQAYGES
jgi:hypothetical protein